MLGGQHLHPGLVAGLADLDRLAQRDAGQVWTMAAGLLVPDGRWRA